MILDNYSLSTFLTCPAKFDLRLRQGWQPNRQNGALNAGLVLHKGIEAWYRTGSLDAALIAIRDAWPLEFPVDDFRTLNKVQSTMREYVTRYPSERFTIVGGPDAPMIEVSFTMPTGMWLDRCPKCQFDHATISPVRDIDAFGAEVVCVDCSAALESIEYGGIFDLLVEDSSVLYVLDHKTTAQMGPWYFSQYSPNNQITGYCWGARELSGRKVGGAIINAIGWTKTQPTKFDRHITTRTPEDIASWLENVRQCANIIKRAEVLGEFPKNTGACTMYGACEFKRVHELPTKNEQLKMLEMYYRIEHWNHEKRDEK